MTILISIVEMHYSQKYSNSQNPNFFLIFKYENVSLRTVSVHPFCRPLPACRKGLIVSTRPCPSVTL